MRVHKDKIEITAVLLLLVPSLLTGCSSKKYPSWSDCMSSEINKNKNLPAAAAYCDANYDMTERERSARHAWYCGSFGNANKPECVKPSSEGTDAASDPSAAVDEGNLPQKNPGQSSPVNEKNQTPTVADFEGKYPWESVGGYTLFEQPLIASSISRIKLPIEVKKFMSDSNVVSGKITVGQWSVEASGCKPHRCDGKSWKLEYSFGEDQARVCYYNSEGPKDMNKWYPDGEIVDDRGCNL